jgi:hypothetical protein|tara:strand:- start:1308 stop:1748 length:441 start_codon:yes stop_codon:yes gene_type:complete
MTLTAITTFIDVEGDKYQNGKIGGSINGHGYLSFYYQGAAKNRNGDNLEAAIVLSANQISMNAVRQAVADKAAVTVETCVMNSDFTSITRRLTQETWIVTGMSYDAETIEVVLSSAIDAVGVTTPRRVLTQAMVGELPISAAISSR